MTKWDIQDSRDLYNIDHWSSGYFNINQHGHMVAHPSRDPIQAKVDLFDLAQEIKNYGLAFPVLVRFMDILRNRVDTLHDAFVASMKTHQYEGQFTAVYPIKVNQNQSVVQELVKHGKHRVGLEAGSKPELLAVLALSEVGRLVVCNGYKDREYIRLALIGCQLGHRVYIVVEKHSELALITEESQHLGITPLIGLRFRSAAIGAGKWQNSGGDKSKFGLSAAQALAMVDRLRDADMLDCLQLLHCHFGSQIANIHDIQRGMRECARYYTELKRMGAPISIVDVGGGLGVDYEGTRSRSSCSVNYSIHEYANNVVHALWEVCEEQGLPHPDIITESGRALTAHHAMLIVNVVDYEQLDNTIKLPTPSDDEPIIIQDLWQSLHRLNKNQSSPVEIYHDANHRLSEVQSMYIHGVLSLQQRANAEKLYYAICSEVRRKLQPDVRSHRHVLDELNEKLADKYFCNFSLFQSIPDVWAINQIFPITPLARLDEKPERRGVIEDITCDSDGRIDQYVDREGIETNLPLHQPHDNNDYLLGIYLVGAYQEILGDMHNLFGDTNSVNVELTSQGNYRLTEQRQGHSVDYVLRYVHFDPDELLAAYTTKIERAAISPEQQQLFLNELAAGLKGYTYLEDR